MSEQDNNKVAVATTTTAAVAPVKGSTVPTTAKAKDSLPALAIMKRLEDGTDEGLPAVILQLSGGDRLFADKFVTCVKAQIKKAWKRQGNGLVNPFAVVPMQSVLDCLYKCAARKILPDGYNAYLIPYQGKNPTCSLQIDYKGLVDCAIREGVILDADAKEVCENDDFYWNCGDVERFSFDFRKPRGQMCGICAWVVLPDGRKKWHYMSKDELQVIRSCVRDTSIWDKWGTEMAKKSALRRIFKTLRNTPRLNDMVELDNEAFDVQGTASPAPYEREKSKTVKTPYSAPRQVENKHDQPAPEPVPVEADQVAEVAAEADPFQ